MITLHSKPYEIDYNELATLKHLALKGAVNKTITASTSEIATELSVSDQTISRRIRQLESSGLLSRTLVPEGQELTITSEGENTLLRELEEYQQIFDENAGLQIKGKITNGLGKAKDYIDLDGYKHQFEELLGYEPYPGTLNVSLNDESRKKRTRLEAKSGTYIEEWKDGEQTYGAAVCYQIRLENSSGETFEPAHILIPDRTDHDESNLEIIGPVQFRSNLDLNKEEEITIHVKE